MAQRGLDSLPVAVHAPVQALGIDPEQDFHRLAGPLRHVGGRGRGYIMEQSMRSQTLSYALTDSPVGQLPLIVEKFNEWTDSKDFVRTPSTATVCSRLSRSTG